MPWCHEPLYTSKFVHLLVADRALYLKAALFHRADCSALGFSMMTQASFSSQSVHRVGSSRVSLVGQSLHWWPLIEAFQKAPLFLLDAALISNSGGPWVRERLWVLNSVCIKASCTEPERWNCRSLSVEDPSISGDHSAMLGPSAQEVARKSLSLRWRVSGGTFYFEPGRI